jgi:hypothetical protein
MPPSNPFADFVAANARLPVYAGRPFHFPAEGAGAHDTALEHDGSSFTQQVFAFYQAILSSYSRRARSGRGAVMARGFAPTRNQAVRIRFAAASTGLEWLPPVVQPTADELLSAMGSDHAVVAALASAPVDAADAEARGYLHLATAILTYWTALAVPPDRGLFVFRCLKGGAWWAAWRRRRAAVVAIWMD